MNLEEEGLRSQPTDTEDKEREAYMIRLFSRMNAHVALERLEVAEVCATDLTRVRLLSRVDQHMGAKMSHLEGKL